MGNVPQEGLVLVTQRFAFARVHEHDRTAPPRRDGLQFLRRREPGAAATAETARLQQRGERAALAERDRPVQGEVLAERELSMRLQAGEQPGQRLARRLLERAHSGVTAHDPGDPGLPWLDS